MAASPLSDSGILGDAWQDARTEVSEIGQQAFTLCRNELDAVRGGGSRAVLLHGEPGSGKTHLLGRLRRHIAECNAGVWLDSVFVYFRMQTVPQQIWRHLRRQLMHDLLRPAGSAPTQLERIVFRQLAAANGVDGFIERWKKTLRQEGERGADAMAKGLHAIVAALRKNGGLVTLNEPLFENLGTTVDRSLEVVLEKLLHRRHVTAAEAWLRGESLGDPDLARLGLPAGLEEADPENAAREFVLQILRLVGKGTPVALCFDQIEALMNGAFDDKRGFFSFGQAVAALHDMADNVLAVSCIQSQYLNDLPGVMGSDYDRVGERQSEIPRLMQAQAERLVTARGGIWREEKYADLFSSSGTATARRVIQRIALPAGTLADEWEDRLDKAERGGSAATSGEALEHGLPLLLGMIYKRQTVRAGAGDIQFTVAGEGGREVGVSICNQVNSNSLKARLKRLQNASLPPPQLVLIRDARLPVSAGAAKTQEQLRDLIGKGARLLRPSPEAVAAVDALRTLLSEAQAGDLTAGGDTVTPATLEQWLSAHLPPSLETLAADIAGGAGAGDPALREKLLDLLDRELLLPAKQAAQELGSSEADVKECATGSDALGYLAGNPAVVFQRAAKAGS